MSACRDVFVRSDQQQDLSFLRIEPKRNRCQQVDSRRATRGLARSIDDDESIVSILLSSSFVRSSSWEPPALFLLLFFFSKREKLKGRARDRPRHIAGSIAFREMLLQEYRICLPFTVEEVT